MDPTALAMSFCNSTTAVNWERAVEMCAQLGEGDARIGKLAFSLTQNHLHNAREAAFASMSEASSGSVLRSLVISCAEQVLPGAFEQSEAASLRKVFQRAVNQRIRLIYHPRQARFFLYEKDPERPRVIGTPISDLKAFVLKIFASSQGLKGLDTVDSAEALLGSLETEIQLHQILYIDAQVEDRVLSPMEQNPKKLLTDLLNFIRTSQNASSLTLGLEEFNSFSYTSPTTEWVKATAGWIKERLETPGPLPPPNQ